MCVAARPRLLNERTVCHSKNKWGGGRGGKDWCPQGKDKRACPCHAAVAGGLWSERLHGQGLPSHSLKGEKEEERTRDK